MRDEPKGIATKRDDRLGASGSEKFYLGFAYGYLTATAVAAGLLWGWLTWT